MSKTNPKKESWDDTAGYELYVGRWSRLLSNDFIRWLNPVRGLTWLEVGCGTGALTSVILEHSAPTYLMAFDKSEAYIQQANLNLGKENVIFIQSDVQSIRTDRTFDRITSGLVLNFYLILRSHSYNSVKN